MKRITLLLSLGLGILLVTGCGEAKRQVQQGIRGVGEHGLSKVVGSTTDKADQQVNKGADAVTGDDKQATDRNALKGNDDDSDKDK